MIHRNRLRVATAALSPAVSAVVSTKRGRPTAMLVPADWPDRKTAARAADRLREIRARTGGATVLEILSMRDEGRR